MTGAVAFIRPARHFAAGLNPAEEDIELRDGQVFVRGAPARAIKLGELASRANPLRGAVKPGAQPGLEATNYFGPERGATAAGVHAMVVEVDRETFEVKILRYVTSHDCGRVINPMVLEGQIHGGIAQGLGLALMEEYHAGRTDNLHDYLIPTAGDVPPIVVHLVEDAEPLGPYGAKGVGEPALVATAPAILNAIHHATGVRMDQVPVTPDRLRAALRHGDSR